MDDIVLGAKQIPNPKGITPKLDTDKPDPPKNTQVKMNITNPPASSVIPHPMEKAVQRMGVRHQLGRYVPKVTEN